MKDLQSRLDARLAGLKKATTKRGYANSKHTHRVATAKDQAGAYSVSEVKLALKKSGLITSKGKIKTLVTSRS